jgi:hypothetical protein
MSQKMTKENQRSICRKYFENYLKENDLEISSLSVKIVESMKIDDVSRVVKREILREMKSGGTKPEKSNDTEKLTEKINQLIGEVDDFHRLYDFSHKEIEFIHQLFKQKNKLFDVMEGQQVFGLKKDDDKEVLKLKDKLSDLHKLDDQTGVSVKLNKDIHKELKEYGRLLGMSIREIIHIGMKDVLKYLETVSKTN